MKCHGECILVCMRPVYNIIKRKYAADLDLSNMATAYTGINAFVNSGSPLRNMTATKKHSCKVVILGLCYHYNLPLKLLFKSYLSYVRQFFFLIYGADNNRTSILLLLLFAITDCLLFDWGARPMKM